MTIGERLRNSYKRKIAMDKVRRVRSLLHSGYQRMILGRRLHGMPVLRIHLGCGEIDDPRFLNVDARPFRHVHYVTHSPLMPALPAGRADMVYACHIFEHISFIKQMAVLKRWHALLKPGGELRLSVPDFEKLIGLHQRKELGFRSIQNALMGGQGYPENFHFALFTADHLTMLLTQAGFSNIRHWRASEQDNWPRDWSWAEQLSLNLRADKP